MDRLDQLRRQKQAGRKKRGHGSVARRVMNGRKHDLPPPVRVHDYKIDPNWFATYQQKDPEDAEWVVIRTPHGLGAGVPRT